MAVLPRDVSARRALLFNHRSEECAALGLRSFIERNTVVAMETLPCTNARWMSRNCCALAALLLFSSALHFEPVQPALLSTGGAFTNAFADYDGDGDLDLFVGFNGALNRLYRNDAGTLLDVAAQVGVAEARATRAVAWGDFDSDGDPDLLVGFAPGRESLVKLYRNDRGRFSDVARVAGLALDSGAVRQPVWVDFDGDGDLDLFLAFRDRANALFRNDSGRFTDVATAVGLADPRKSVGAVWFDYDEDGDLDLYVANMDGNANGLWRNDRGTFVDDAAGAGLMWGGRLPGDASNGTVRPCVADVNNDGHLDLFMANYGRNGVFLNRGAGKFEDVSAMWGMTIDARHDACAFADFDNDGNIDVYVNGTVTGGKSYRDYLYRNEGTNFVDVTPMNIEVLEADHGVQWADFDGDGDEDLALTGSQAAGMHHLMRNLLSGTDPRRSLRVAVTDSAGRAVHAGAEVRVYAAGSRMLLGTRWIDAGSGYDAQSAMPVHFGLRRTGAVDVEVIAPLAGNRRATIRSRVNPRDWSGCVLTIAIGATASLRRCR